MGQRSSYKLLITIIITAESFVWIVGTRISWIFRRVHNLSKCEWFDVLLNWIPINLDTNFKATKYSFWVEVSFWWRNILSPFIFFLLSYNILFVKLKIKVNVYIFILIFIIDLLESSSMTSIENNLRSWFRKMKSTQRTTLFLVRLTSERATLLQNHIKRAHSKHRKPYFDG